MSRVLFRQMTFCGFLKVIPLKLAALKFHLNLTLLRSVFLMLSMVPNIALPAICWAVIWSMILGKCSLSEKKKL